MSLVSARGPVCFRLALVFAVLALTAANARAVTPREVENPRTAHGAWVTDHAGVLGDDAESSINAIADDLKRRSGAELAVVTVPETGDQSPRQFATELFNLWGIGERGRDNGVLVLIATGPRRIEVETGYGAEGDLPDARVGRILDTYVIPRLREGDWDGGTVAGVRELAAALIPPDSASGTAAMPYRNPPVSWPASEPVPPQPSPWPIFLILGLPLAVAGAAVWHASRTRQCETCRRAMRRLTPRQEHAYLSADEEFEQVIRSIDHVVWRCDDCQSVRIEPRAMWFSGYEECPGCHRRTLRTTNRTLLEATYERAGSREVTRGCRLRRCRHRDSRRETIPKLEVTSSWSSSSGGGGGSSGGGGSFGGGSSGGGGSGRGW